MTPKDKTTEMFREDSGDRTERTARTEHDRNGQDRIVRAGLPD